ncbi:unnamed protein product [Paramecium sonneborni]|uniref:Uncharacterized protein n=1 Tax=Paramecium sonneborni TaxID=65129 RepID=A0A8S1N673_9CILI|nr:unnamed protein product [Paramecium sonneborni]CAD8085103.1 unnamed protein product [Paramecium sonneborni]
MTETEADSKLIYLGCNRVVYQSEDKRIKLYELRQLKKTDPFVYFPWVKGPGQKTLGKGKWYIFKNYEIANEILVPVASLYSSYKQISKYKINVKGLKIESMRAPYQNILGVIKKVSDLDTESRQYSFRILKVLLVDKTVVEILLKQKFATRKVEKFKEGEIIYIYQCKLNNDYNNNRQWYSSLRNNTKIKFDLEIIKGHVGKLKLNEVKKLVGINDFDEETGQFE